MVPGVDGEDDGPGFRPGQELRKKGQADINSTVNYVGSQTFKRDDQESSIRWVDMRFDKQSVIKVTTYSDEYFELLADYEWLGDYLAQGENVVLVVDDVALEITADEVATSASDLSKLREALSKAKGM